jgi:hypothetical protein
MHDPGGMRLLERGAGLKDIAGGVRRREGAMRHPLSEILAREALHYDVGGAILQVSEIEDARYVFARQAGARLRLPKETGSGA